MMKPVKGGWATLPAGRIKLQQGRQQGRQGLPERKLGSARQVAARTAISPGGLNTRASRVIAWK
jgi:hypothetical protein